MQHQRCRVQALTHSPTAINVHPRRVRPPLCRLRASNVFQQPSRTHLRSVYDHPRPVQLPPPDVSTLTARPSHVGPQRTRDPFDFLRPFPGTAHSKCTRLACRWDADAKSRLLEGHRALTGPRASRGLACSFLLGTGHISTHNGRRGRHLNTKYYQRSVVATEFLDEFQGNEDAFLESLWRRCPSRTHETAQGDLGCPQTASRAWGASASLCQRRPWQFCHAHRTVCYYRAAMSSDPYHSFNITFVLLDCLLSLIFPPLSSLWQYLIPSNFMSQGSASCICQLFHC
ncbi:hypothetical protein EDC04DRAFT_255314 [Pisolithus marmoratus]|nr:hypothetical protein EDC04DRAFT_255314 [Pisolithus marmoratus]